MYMYIYRSIQIRSLELAITQGTDPPPPRERKEGKGREGGKECGDVRGGEKRRNLRCECACVRCEERKMVGGMGGM